MQIDEATYQRVVECLEQIRSSANVDVSRVWAYEALDILGAVTIDGEGTRPAMQKLLDDFDARHPEIIARIDSEEKP